MTDSILWSLAGGLLIGGAASLLLWLNGRIAGVSNIFARLLLVPVPAQEAIWRVLFLLGIIGGAWLAYYAGVGVPPVARAGFPAWLLAAAGLLVGFGTSLGNGCTSGHGVCGLGRLSLRSLVATLVFLGVAIVTTFVARHVFGMAT